MSSSHLAQSGEMDGADNNNSSLEMQPQQPAPQASPRAAPPPARQQPPPARQQQEQQQQPQQLINPEQSQQQQKPGSAPSRVDEYPRLPNGKRDYSRSLAQIAAPHKTFDSDITIYYKDVSVTAMVPLNQAEVKTVFSPCVDLARCIKTSGASCGKREFHCLKDVSGVIRPSELTLVIAPAGHGKSTFLRALANRVATTTGQIVYNGRTFEQAEAEGCDLRKMTQYTDQTDVHSPVLTVYETIDFAHSLTSVNYDPQRVEDTLKLLGLEECRDTIIGNALIRGVSGGQRKRVTSGELLVSDASVLFLDEFSNGLDSSTSVDIMAGLKKFCLQYNSSIVATLQQPTPELFALFDRIVVLSAGQVVFQGPTADVEPYFAAMGYHIPEDVDTADFLLDVLMQPRTVLLRQKQEEQYLLKKQKTNNNDNNSNNTTTTRQKKQTTFDTSYGPIHASPVPCITAQEMAEFYLTTPQWAEIKEELDQKIPTPSSSSTSSSSSPAIDTSQFKPLMPTERSKDMYKMGYRLPIFLMMSYVLSRQFKWTIRNKSTLIPRMISAVLMSLLYGSLYWHVKADEYILRLSALLLGVTQIAFANFVEIPTGVANQNIVFKQLAARFYPSWTYALSTLFLQIPMAVVDSTIYSLFLYFMTFNYRGPMEFFTFYAVLIAQSCFLGSWYRLLAAVGGDEQAAQALSGPSTNLFLVFGGLFISRSSLPDFMIWLYWLSPFSYSVRALANNEFLSPRYDQLVQLPSGEFERIGNTYLSQLDMYIGGLWILVAIIFLVGGCFVIVLLTSWKLIRKYHVASIGTRRDAEAELVVEEDGGQDGAEDFTTDADLKAQVTRAAIQQVDIENSKRSQIASGAAQSGNTITAMASANQSTGLKTLTEECPFTPGWLSFHNVSYTVKVNNSQGQTVDRVLLNNVCGYAQPGKLLALMGASGAGKTTLLDCLAGLKNTGDLAGDIRINGQPITPTLLATMTGYCEQFDTLFAYSTVRETLEFAARCRLPRSVPDATKMKIVAEILQILELESISHYIIGNHIIKSLSPAQAKRVSIGVELVANPSILFLDEPTTGLDSKSAQTVMQVVKRVARSGRAIICTIHQPSAELFYLFDRLLLLGQGGWQIYFGELGRRGKYFVNYLQQCPGVQPIAPRVNPASWMLVELGVGVASEKKEAAPGSLVQKDNADPRFKIEDDPEWAQMTLPQRTIQRFVKIYLQSEQYQKTAKRLDVLHNIELIDIDNTEALQQYKQEYDQASRAKHQAALQQQKSSSPDQQQNVHNTTPHDIMDVSRTTIPTKTTIIPSPQRLYFLEQFYYLFRRNFMCYYRNQKSIYARFMVMTVMSILFGLLYLQIDPKTSAQATSMLGSSFMICTLVAIASAQTALPILFNSRATFYREKAAGFYSPGLFSPVAWLIEMVWLFYGALIPTTITYFMTGLAADFGIWIRFCLATYILAMAYISFAMMNATLTPHIQLAQIVQGSFLSTQNALSGMSITLNVVPRGYIWLFRALPYLNNVLYLFLFFSLLLCV